MSDEVKAPETVTLPPASPENLLEWLRPIQDPELFLGLVDLGLIYSVHLDGGAANITMTLTSPDTSLVT